MLLCRYRQRKKAKASELKQTVETLQDRVDELSEMKAKKDELAVCPRPSPPCMPHTLAVRC